jgi:hypothetical protein
MKTTSVTVSHEELLSLSPELQQKHREKITPKCVTTTSNEHTGVNLSNAIPFTDSDLPSSELPMPAAIISNDTVGHFTYILENPFNLFIQKLQPGEQMDVLTVVKESHALQLLDMLVNNQEYIEAIVDPRLQIIAMSEAVCHNLNLQYDPRIRLKMQLANSSVDLSLGLSHNVPAQIRSITLYLQIHVIWAPAYDILLGRPFNMITELVVHNYKNKDQTITICDPNTSQMATILSKP